MNENERKIIEEITEFIEKGGTSEDSKEFEKRRKQIYECTSIAQVEAIVGSPMPAAKKVIAISLYAGLFSENPKSQQGLTLNVLPKTIGEASFLMELISAEITLGLMGQIEFWIYLGKGLGFTEEESAELMVGYANSLYAFYKEVKGQPVERGNQVEGWFKNILKDSGYNQNVVALPNEDNIKYYD